MFYGTVQGVKDRLPKLAKFIKAGDSTDPRDIPESVVEAILEDYTLRVNAALGGIYAVPFQDPPPPIIENIVMDLAAVRLSQRYLTTLNTDENINLLTVRKDAQRVLDDLASGAASLPGISRIFVEGPDLDLGVEEESFFDMEDPASWQGKI